jgi:hypothetical protein
VQYRRPDGYILGIWQAAVDTALQDQGEDPTATVGYQLVDTEIPITSLVVDYYMADVGLVLKDVLTLTATPTSIPADGISEAIITVTPFVPCSLIVSGQVFELTVGDEELVLTADSPQIFLITLAPIAAYKADAITLEAT